MKSAINGRLLILAITLFALTTFLSTLSICTPAALADIDTGMVTGTPGPIPDTMLFTGGATHRIPIIVPPGRGGLAPSLSINYNSYGKNGWLGVGWSLSIGEIRRSTKKGVCYSCDEYIVEKDGNTIELVNKDSDEYSAKIEGSFSRIYHNPTTGGWEVVTKTGVTYYYGSDLSSRIHDPADDTRVFKWFLDKVRDPNGNTLTVFYEGADQEIYPSRIEYPGNNAVIFILDPVTRPDIERVYTPGFEFCTTKRLKSIEVLGNGQLSREYSLNYIPSAVSNRSLLNRITLIGSNGTEFRNYTLSYQEGPTGEIENWFHSEIDNAGGWKVGDFNADGRADVIRSHINGTTQLYIMGADGNIVEYWNWEIDLYNKAWQLGDFNGDGRTDLIRAHPDGTTNIFIVGEGGAIADSWNWPIDLYNKAWQLGDFNGDGRTDLVRAHPDGTTQAYIVGEGGAIADYWNWGIDLYNKAWQLGDFNGDGRTDLIRAHPDGTTQAYIFGEGGAIADCWNWSIDLVDKTWLLGDFNGDGYKDIIRGHPNGTTQFYLLDGIGNIINTWDWQVDLSNRPSLIGDFNGDGITDVIRNSNGLDIYTIAGQTPDLLSEVSNDFNANVKINYTNSSEFDNTYLPFIVHPVSMIEVDDGNGISASTSYQYEGGYYDPIEREFRGFKKVTRVHPNGSIEKTLFYQGNPENDLPIQEENDPEDSYYLKGRPKFIEARESNDESSDGNLISRTDITYGLRAEGNGSQFVYMDYKISKTYQNGQVVLQMRDDPVSHDDVGNLTEVVTCEADSLTGDCVSDGSTEKITRTFTYANLGTASEPRWRKTWEQVQGQGATSGVVRQTWYRYTNDGKANLEEKEYWHQEGTNPIFRFEYDGYGNVWKEWDAKNQLISEYTYDSDTHTYLVAVSNALGHTLTKTYDARFGTVTSETDANGNTTYYDYDEFGRLISVDLSTGGRSIVEYHDDTVPHWVKKRVLESTNPDSYIDTYEYFDGLGRTIQTVSPGEGGDKQVVTRIVYDNMGRQKEMVGPYFVTGTAEGVLFDIPTDNVPKSWTDYDLRSRPVTTYSLDGQHGTITSQISYSGLSSTVTDPDGAQKTTVKDYLGRVIEVVEHTDGGDIHTQYAYNSAGDLTDVTDPAGNITHMEYDTLGRKISMTDPDMGFWEYRYDANGNLEWQKDANEKEIQFGYDVLDRMVSKQYLTPIANVDHDVAFIYDDPAITTLNPKGHLSQVTNSVVTETYNKYDALGKLLSVSKTISGDSTRTTEFAYDLSGKLTSTIYPDNYQVNNLYYPGTGLLQSVIGINDLTTYATFSDYPATGKTKRIVYGNDVTTDFTYNSLSARLESIVTQQSSNGQFINRSYTFTAAGDIETIDDAVTGNTRFYEYDKLHRLKREYSSADDYSYLTPSALSYNYNTDSYAAGSSRPVHAVGKIDSLDGSHNLTYDANGNMLTGPDLADPSSPASRTISYNSDNMPCQITHSEYGTTTFSYDGGGSRAKKSGPNGTTYYYGAIFENNGGQLVKYIFAGGQRVAMVKGGQTYYFHKDHLGSSSVITDATGAKAQEEDYLPFGGHRGTSSITVSSYGYTDQEKDSETGFYNYNARLYDSAIAVFMTADTMVPDPSGSQSFNRYTYCGNNPLIYVDPSGHSFLSDIWEGLRDEFDPSRAFKNGGIIGYWMHMSDIPGFNTLSYTYEGGFASSGGYNYGGLDFGGGWQQKGPNSGAYGYIGYGVSYKGIHAGAHFMNNNHGDYSISLGVSVYGAQVGYGYSNVSGWGWTAGVGYAGFSMNYDFNSGRGQISVNPQAVAEFSIEYYKGCLNAKTKKMVKVSILIADNSEEGVLRSWATIDGLGNGSQSLLVNNGVARFIDRLCLTLALPWAIIVKKVDGEPFLNPDYTINQDLIRPFDYPLPYSVDHSTERINTWINAYGSRG